MLYAVLLVGCLCSMGGLLVLMNRGGAVFVEATDGAVDAFSVFMMLVLSGAALWLVWHLLW